MAARKSRILRLDGPLSALDTALRERMRLELPRLLTGFDTPTFVATIGRVLPDGAAVRLELDCGFRLVALIPRQTAKSFDLDVGNVVTVHLPAAAGHLIPQTEGNVPSRRKRRFSVSEPRSGRPGD